jgi:hypothetical protein
MAGEETTSKGNITNNYNAAQTGLNMDSSVGQIPKGKLTYALNANVENFDSNSVNYQNEEGNKLCLDFPDSYILIGTHFIPEKDQHIFFLVSPSLEMSQIGYMSNNDCVYRTYVESACLNFSENHPIHKAVHRITNCSTEIYWTDGYNTRRYMDLQDIPSPFDCNRIKIQPDFTIPQLTVADVITGGELISGTYQFAIQYCDAQGFGYTSYYSITNPTPIANPDVEILDFNYPVNRSIRLDISNLDVSGYFKYYNLAVIKNINSIESVELVGTYYIDSTTNEVTYTGQNQTQIRLSINDIFEKFPYYDIAEDLTSVQDILVWDNLTSNDRINYQSIATGIALQWETYKIPATENYADEINATKLRGYLRDEVYAFEIVFLLKNGKQTDGFHIPGRLPESADLAPQYKPSNPDYIGPGVEAPTWKIYNTAIDLGVGTGSAIGNATPHRYGEFAYWESEETYPNTPVWGSLAGQNIRHYKFPDVLVSPIFESAAYNSGVPVVQESDAVYPIGVRVNTTQIINLIANSNLTQEQKNNIAGFKIVRGNRSTNKSIVGKGIIRNVGKYTREGTEYYYPNYPYNDVTEDPFLLEQNNAFSSQSTYWIITTSLSGSIQYTDAYTGELTSKTVTVGTSNLCSITRPVGLTATITVSSPVADYGGVVFIVTSESTTRISYQDPINYPSFTQVDVVLGSPVAIVSTSTPTYISGNTRYVLTRTDTLNPHCYPANLSGFDTDASKLRMVFNSPETSFGQPSLGSVLKLENAMIGAGRSHFVQVKNNARYKLLTTFAQQQALTASYNLANSVSPFDPNAMFTTYQAYLTIYINGITRRNYGYSFNSVASYDYWKDVSNSGNKQRELDIYQYITSGVQSVSDDHDINNFQRESSVYLKTNDNPPLPYAQDSANVVSTGIIDDSRFSISQRNNCGNAEKLEDISVVSYYASLKNIVPSQYGQIYTYQTIDTGFQVDLDYSPGITTFFGGDTFISRFAFKTKLPFFIDNRVGAPDDSDVFYDEIGNIAYPQYWHSARSILSNFKAGSTELTNVISVKANYLDCPNGVNYANTTTTTSTTLAPGSVSSGNPNYVYDGKMYMFAYGIPYFYCESSINTDLRQAFNEREGNFYPHVSTGIPDSWLQQTNVPIAFDNTYYYNTSYSKQNTENFFSHLPTNWTDDQCNTVFPFRAIYSDAQVSDATNKVNNWLIYRPISFFDFPQSYGDLVSLDGIQNKAILARFENKSLLYNTMLTIDTSNPQAAYLGNSSLFRSAPPIDFAETDLGYVGSQNKMLLKIPQGQITVDAKRGQIFLISGNGAIDITAFGSGVQRFMTDHLAFEILRFFPEADIDNNFTSVGLHGVYDSKYDRVIISKLDYIPNLDKIGQIYYDNDPLSKNYGKYYIYPVPGNTRAKQVIALTNRNYFCNRSWTLSFNMNTKSWISFHSYIPNYYIAENNFFYSGLNESCDLTAIAAIEVPDCVLAGTAGTTTSTTTTTTTIYVPPTPGCELAGNAELVPAGCELEGNAATS